MPKGQKPYRPMSKRPILPKAGLTTFGKEKAETTASVAKGTMRSSAPKPVEAGMKGDVMGYNTARPALERGKYLEEEIKRRSR